MNEAIFLNGVYESVLEEILDAQENHQGKIFYLQPYSSRKIRKLAQKNPSLNNPIPLYISTTTDLDKICYKAQIVGWENKQTLSSERLNELNHHIEEFQPNEEEIYLTVNGTDCVNLLSIVDLKRLTNQFSVKNLTKINNSKPLQPRTQSGNWAYVKELPSLFDLEDTSTEDQLKEELEQSIEESSKLDEEARKERLSSVLKKPEPIQVISKGFRRNPDVIVEVLIRADGTCERCGEDAPFLRAKDGTPYLEIHHWVPLAEGGEDTVENAGALCPNCHREVHYGQTSELITPN